VRDHDARPTLHASLGDVITVDADSAVSYRFV
jgi:hypothetical protein